MPEEPERRPPPRLQRSQVQPSTSDETEAAAFRYRGLLRRAQALQAQPIELSQEIWTQADDVWRLDPEPSDSSDEPETPSVDEAALRAAIEAEWQERLAEAIRQARAEGEAAGRAAAEAEWAPRLQALQEQLARELERLRQAWADYTRQLEPMLVELAIEVAEALLDAPLPESLKGVSARMLTEAVEQLARSAPLEISLHPVDFLRLQEQGIVAQLENRHPDLHWDLNPGLHEGDWIVQTPTAMQRRIRQEMLQRLRQRLGITPSPETSNPEASHTTDAAPPSDHA
ncbi:flagellar assembly protein FliH [Rhodothermus profundi]|uniref:Flagellar assembly protein FliH n=2 Tax=Rhodothermus profundi TaxID=633813 RepID=A0A1M6X6W2_9BACT|nr:flagellar assembly protein FliH [Rhodothermus profundi]